MASTAEAVVNTAAAAAAVVERLAPPRTPPPATMAWLLVRYAAVRRALLDTPVRIRSGDGELRQYTESLRRHVDDMNRFFEETSASAPLTEKEAASLAPIVALGEPFLTRVYPLMVALLTAWTVGGDALVHVAAGGGVVATRDLARHTLVTSYPVDLLRVRAGGVAALFVRDIACRDVEALRRRLDPSKRTPHAHMDVYGGDSGDGGDSVSDCDSDSAAADACGHRITREAASANCVVCSLMGGVVLAVLTTRAIRDGEELFLDE